MCQVVMIPSSFFANDGVDRESRRNWLELTVPTLIGREHPRGTDFYPSLKPMFRSTSESWASIDQHN